VSQTPQSHPPSLPMLSLAALGIVFGDIGTSPLYALKQTLQGMPINVLDVLGLLSLIFWSFILIVSIKYLIILFQSENDGEGGILALLALVKQLAKKRVPGLFLIGIFGAGFLLGDGMITPAISVLSAVEGINTTLPALSQWILPITVIILILLFSLQSYGTSTIGFLFGPVLLVWFITIAILGSIAITHNPIVWHAMDPRYAFGFLYHHGWKGYSLLGGVFLVLTGAEALYADLGHFGKTPIRCSWFALVLPSLVLNYFGQGALLLSDPSTISSPFFNLAPPGWKLPLLILATLATIIASQAIISATFSLTRQAILLGLYPHLPVIQTSKTQLGQIYIPQMNFILAAGTLFLVFQFRSADALAHAYGITVNLQMLLTTCLVTYIAIRKWHCHWSLIVALFSIFIIIDCAFLGANSHKIATGGWIPIVFASLCANVMYTWKKGRQKLQEQHYMKKETLEKILRQLDYKTLHRLPDTTAVFITDIYDKSGGSFLHFLKLNRTIPDHILMVSYIVENIPHVTTANRFQIHCLKPFLCELTLHYGFMDNISIPHALKMAHEHKLIPFPLDIDRLTYFIEIPNVIASRKVQTLHFYWQEKLFAFLMRNYAANMNIEFYKLPFNRTIAMGTYYLI